MRLAFTETLSGGVHPPGDARRVQAMTIELEVRARGIVDSVLGAPFAVEGRLRAEPPREEPGLVPANAAVTGTLRLLVSAGLFYDLRIAPGPVERGEHVAAPRDQLELRGARRFVRGDLFASATTFDGVLARRGAQIGDVRLRFDVRDDVPRLVRSLRLG